MKRAGRKTGKARSFTNAGNKLQDGGFFQRNLWIIPPLLVVFLGLVVYANTFQVRFIFDDFTSIVDNPAIRSFSALFSDFNLSRIFGFFTFALNYRLGGLDVVGYHVFNLAVHILSALLVFWLVSLTLRTPFFKERGPADSGRLPLTVALFCALIFVAHPIETQAVTYVVQRFTSLCTLFYLFSLIMYACWRLAADKPEGYSLMGHDFRVSLKTRRLFFLALSLTAALLAMLSKEIAFTLPVVVALWELFFMEGPLKKRLLCLLPFALTLPVIPLVLLLGGASLTEAGGAEAPPPASHYFFTQPRVLITYLRLMVLPTGQNLDYDYPLYSSPFEPAVLLSVLLLLSIVALALMLFYLSRKGGRNALLGLCSFGILWFFITISLESSFISIADLIYEHRLYLPSVGLIIAAVAAAAWAQERLKRRIPQAGKLAVALGAVVVVALSVATFERNKVWGDQVAFWQDVVSKSPGKYRARHNLGVVYMERGNSEKARREFEAALSIDSAYPKADSAYNILGRIYLERGDYDKAQYFLTQAIALRYDFADAHNNLGVVHAKRSEYGKAESEYRLAIESDPYFADAYENLGLNYIQQGRYSEAIEPYLKVVELDPRNSGVHNDLGNLYAMQGDYNKALSEYRAALAIDPNNQGARANIQRLQGPQTSVGAGRT